MPSLQVLPQSRSATSNSSTAGYGIGQGVRSSRSSSVSSHKAMPTCKLSLAHAEFVVTPLDSTMTMTSVDSAPSPPIPIPFPNSVNKVTATPVIDVKTPRSRFTSTSSSYRPNEVNVIPFPTTTTLSFSSMSSSRPLPIPPRPHALLRASAVISATVPPVQTSTGNGTEDLPRRVRVRKGSLVSSPAPALPKSPLGVGAPKRAEGLIVPPPRMERRKSRDPNVADHLVVEVDDADEVVVAARMDGNVVVEDEDDVHVVVPKAEEAMLATDMESLSRALRHIAEIPSRPSSPTPDVVVSSRPARSTSPNSPESTAPPAYSTLPPPYSASDYEDTKSDDKVDVEAPLLNTTNHIAELVVLERQPAPIVVPIPSRTHKPSLSSTSPSSSAGPSAYKRSRVSTSELKVLVYLYRTVVYGLEIRRRHEEKEEREAKASRLSSRAPSPLSKENDRRQRKPLGPRATPQPSSPHLKSSLPPPEHRKQLETALLSAAMPRLPSSSPTMIIKGKERAYHGFGAFPLVEEDDDVANVVEEEVEHDDESYPVPRTPIPSPSQSPRSTPPPLTASGSSPMQPRRSLSPLDVESTLKKDKSKTEVNSELDVQDALLAIRLREFLKAQGVCEEDLHVEVENEVVEEQEVHVEDGKDIGVATGVPTENQTQDDDDDEGSILDEYFMGIEEEDDASDSETTAKPKSRGVLVEEEDATPHVLLPAHSTPSTNHKSLSISTTTASSPSQSPSQSDSRPRTMSPPPASPSPRPRAVLPTSYMVALLTMRMRHPSRRPSSGSSSSSSSSDKGGKGRSKGYNEGATHGTKRKSGLSVIVEAD